MSKKALLIAILMFSAPLAGCTDEADTDDDGVGDNADAFPEDPSEWADTDDDGVGDNADAFPEDPSEWADTDGDGWGDNIDWNATNPDTNVTSTSESVTSDCELRKRVIEEGMDNGDGGGTPQNGILEPGEIDSTTTICEWIALEFIDWTGDFDSGPSYLTRVGSLLYFNADDDSSGRELWAHDPSNGSIWQVADINPGSDHSDPRLLTAAGSVLYFTADDGSSGQEVWAHDPSSGSTWQVADINPGQGNSAPWTSSNKLTVVGSVLYFTADDGSSGREVWAHDPSSGSTWQVTEIVPGGGSDPWYLAAVGPYLYFTANDGSSGREVWAHDPSSGSTWQVADISLSNNQDSSRSPDPWYLTAAGSVLYFTAEDDSALTRDLWAHDPSNGSTWKVTEFVSTGDCCSNPWYLTAAGSVLYFTAEDGSSGRELWAHDPSNGSTWQVADIKPGSGGGGGSNPWYLTAAGSVLYFTADDGSSGREVWAHDSSNGSTWQVTDIYPGSGDSNPNWFTTIGSTVYFAAVNGSSETELWSYGIVSQITIS